MKMKERPTRLASEERLRGVLSKFEQSPAGTDQRQISILTSLRTTTTCDSRAREELHQDGPRKNRASSRRMSTSLATASTLAPTTAHPWRPASFPDCIGTSGTEIPTSTSSVRALNVLAVRD